MLRLYATIKKEFLILLRDKGGLAVMFLMPMVMITLMAFIQDGPFRDYQEMKISLLYVNNDNDSLGAAIERGLKNSKIFEITNAAFSGEEVKQKIKSDEFKIGIIVPEHSTRSLNAKVDRFVSKKLAEAGFPDSTDVTTPVEGAELQILFAPDTKKSFKTSIIGSIRQATSRFETQALLDLFKKEMTKGGSEVKENEPLDTFIELKEINTVETQQEALQLNSVQHNVPAWTVFGMFFIVISMSGSIIKERDDGSLTRVRSMPGSFLVVLAGKISSYLIVCLIQCVLMISVGLFILPHMGLPTLVIGHNVPAILVMAVSTGLAATGYGILIGTIFKTHQQSSTFGAVSVVIMAALGGIWVPVFVMPESIRFVAEYSPLYWGLSGFHKLFLSGGGVRDVLPYAVKLIGFCIGSLVLANFIDRNKRH
ncbi:MAG: ABC transporter permease [Bacteroidia bacterium]